MPLHRMRRVEPPWRGIMDKVWEGMTARQACEALDYPYTELMWHWNDQRWHNHKRVILDTAMLANYRDEEVLNG